MPDDPKPTPREVKREDYAWCETCKLYWPKKSLETGTGFFSSDPTTKCPEGHAVQLEGQTS